MQDRTELTQSWLDQLDPEIRPALATAMIEWWRNIRDTGGLGLTDLGHTWLTQELNIPVWEYHIPHTDQASMGLGRVLILDRHCPCVYWFKMSSKAFHLSFFDSKEAMTYNLYGDLGRYLDMLKRT
jgi:hypothetical protein